MFMSFLEKRSIIQKGISLMRNLMKHKILALNNDTIDGTVRVIFWTISHALPQRGLKNAMQKSLKKLILFSCSLKWEVPECIESKLSRNISFPITNVNLNTEGPREIRLMRPHDPSKRRRLKPKLHKWKEA